MGDMIPGAPGTPGSQGRYPKVTLDTLFQRIAHGTYRPVLRGGRYAGTIHKPDNAALRSALGRLDRATARTPTSSGPRKGHRKEKGRSV